MQNLLSLDSCDKLISSLTVCGSPETTERRVSHRLKRDAEVTPSS